MLTLAFDTSTQTGLVAVFKEGKLLDQKHWRRDVSHGELLTPAIVDCLKNANHSLSEIERIVVGIGPGSFTGARISINAARTFGYSLGKPVFSVDTTELLAAGVPSRTENLVTLIKANGNQAYVSTFKWNKSEWSRQTPLIALDLENLASHLKMRHLCVGDAYLNLGEQLSHDLKSLLTRDSGLSDSLEAENFMKIDFTRRAATDWKSLQALYIKASSAEEKIGEGLGKKNL
jgi:tRNA threonylcarbamoyl adenosine modification protein YeaZ